MKLLNHLIAGKGSFVSNCHQCPSQQSFLTSRWNQRRE